MNNPQNKTDDITLKDSIFKIGRVVSVSGREIKIKVDKTKNSSHLLYKGDLLKNVTVGGYVKIIKGFVPIIAKVESEYIREEKAINEFYSSNIDRVDRELLVKLLGYLERNTFQRGIKEIPLIDNECFLLERCEFELIHDFVKAGDDSIKIGTLALEKGQEIRIGITSLFSSHFGIFGNTGSGKSYTLSKLYREFYEKFKENAKFQTNTAFFLIDFNGEYVENKLGRDIIVEEEFKSIYELSTAKRDGGDKYPVSQTLINESQFWSVFLQATEKTQLPFINRTLNSDFLENRFSTSEGIKDLISKNLILIVTNNNPNQEKDLVISFLEEISKNNVNGSLNGLNELINDYRMSLKYHSLQKIYYYESSNTTTIWASDPNVFIPNVINEKVNALVVDASRFSPIQIIRLKLIFNYYFEILKGYSNKEHIAPLIGRLDKRINDLEKVIIVDGTQTTGSKNFTIISLRDVNLHMRKILPLLLCKQIYERKKEENDKLKYLNIIIDEAHNILSHVSDRESETWKDYRLETFEEIIKEGRKFGVFLTIASQRPYDISPTIISQIHNYFLHRLINNYDIDAVGTTISYLDKVSVDSLSILPTGTCILAGQIAQVPVIVAIDRIEDRYEPYNKTVNLLEIWSDDDNATDRS